MNVYCAHDEMVAIKDLKLNPDNRNTHPPEQIERLAGILKYQGWRYPVKISNQTGLVVSGHGRVLAAKLNGWKHVPVNRQDYDTPEQEYADSIADNAIASWSELNLSGIQMDVAGLCTDFNIDYLGMKDFAKVATEVLEPGCDEDEVPEHVESTTKLGDLYRLGNHRLLCGDSTQIDCVDKLMNSEKADMVFTDPPYNVAFNGRSGKHDVIKNDDLSASDFDAFIEDVCQTIAAVDAPIHYIWCNWKFYSALQTRISYKACIVWAKNVFGMGVGYRHQHEFCLFNGKIDEDIKNESDLWNCKKDHNYVHPTQKPVELAERAIGNHAGVKDILDLFGGSGSTLIACEKTQRRCFMMELDPHYCDVIVARWEKYTGKKAELLDG